jgi:cytochrome b561
MAVEKYSLPLRVLHGLTAVTIVSLLVVGFYMADIDADAVDKYELYPLHKSFGMVALLLVMIRLPVRFKGTIPAPAHWLQTWEKKLSHVVHLLLYVAMLTMTWSGLFMNSTYPYVTGIDVFGLFTVPDITPKSEYWNDIAHQFHTFAAWSFVVLLGLHLGGVFKHRMLDGKDKDVLGRML